MSSEDFEQRFQHHVEFMLEQQSRFDERLNRLEESQIRQTENINRLVDVANATQVQVDSIITELRDTINNLIVANEVSRHLAEEATKLAIQTSQRVTGIDRRVTDLESKQ
jgi:uncharacterized coiled-coil protein SlyX